MKCEDARLLISIHAEGDLPEAEQATLKAHLRACERCAEFEAENAILSSRLRESLSEIPAHRDLTEPVMSLIPARRGPVRRVAWALVPGLCLLAAAFVLIGRPVLERSAAPVAQERVQVAPQEVPAPVPVVKTPEEPPVRISRDDPKRQDPPRRKTHRERMAAAGPVPAEGAPAESPSPGSTDPPPTPAKWREPEVGEVCLESGASPHAGLVRIASAGGAGSITLSRPRRTTADVCVVVPSVTGTEKIRLYEVPVTLPEEPMLVALDPRRERAGAEFRD